MDFLGSPVETNRNFMIFLLPRCVPDSSLSSAQLEALILKLCRSWYMDKETGERAPWPFEAPVLRKNTTQATLEVMIEKEYEIVENVFFPG